MVVFGSKATEVATETIQDKCANCGTQNSVQMTVFQKYAHVFWIPFFPIGKTGLTQCSHCKQVLEKKEFPVYLRSNYEILKQKGKTPVWTFSGIILLFFFFILGGIVSKQREEKNLMLIASPQAGDIYEIKIDYKQYTLYKVENIEGDTVFVLLNEYETNKRRGLSDSKIRRDESFSGETFPILKTDLKMMVEDGEIMDIERK
ncbi:zinc ribbon domain-containing protein [Aquiflexum gelatinilyticum]|uniref:zinc ribbon domain-containing protein n=1 Tax=Aquiflexum gelatinilyticum TaxID=2961943 RepID=UPI0021678408|nr:zinc ribbon domain-containing protein [Aquiflexum gelatinilyticum]MCS4436686.1 zinc ribbon domain-containing protein [Aquiflexum gelatinilyticum]